MKTMLKYRVLALKTLLVNKKQLLIAESSVKGTSYAQDAVNSYREDLDNIQTFLDMTYSAPLSNQIAFHFDDLLDRIKSRIEGLRAIKVA